MSGISLDRRRKLGLVHTLAADAGLDEGERRDHLERLTKHRSARDCTDAQLDLVITSFHGKQNTNNPYAAKIRALFIACWNIGALESGDDRALDALVKRQTGKERLTFITPVEQS